MRNQCNNSIDYVCTLEFFLEYSSHHCQRNICGKEWNGTRMNERPSTFDFPTITLIK
jgi:hypothetical protein